MDEAGAVYPKTCSLPSEQFEHSEWPSWRGGRDCVPEAKTGRNKTLNQALEGREGPRIQERSSDRTHELPLQSGRINSCLSPARSGSCSFNRGFTGLARLPSGLAGCTPHGCLWGYHLFNPRSLVRQSSRCIIRGADSPSVILGSTFFIWIVEHLTLHIGWDLTRFSMSCWSYVSVAFDARAMYH